MVSARPLTFCKVVEDEKTSLEKSADSVENELRASKTTPIV